MYTIYMYVLDTLADWEIGNLTAELHSKRFFKKDAQSITLKTVSYSKETITTMGGMKIVPDCTIDEMKIDKNSMLILPGADTWNDPKHRTILQKTSEFLEKGAMVSAICGATAALACCGYLNNRPHTSNGVGFLEMVAPGYDGTAFYLDQPLVTDHNLITASSTGSLLWTKQIIACLDVFAADTLEAWYNYFSTGDANQFFALMQSLPARN